MSGFGEFLMRPTKIVGRTKQIHSRFQTGKMGNCMATFAGQSRLSLSHRSIQALNKGGVQNESTQRGLP
jgi:hypothetical protein